MKKLIEQILRAVLGELLGAEKLSALAKAVLERLLDDKEWVRQLARKIAAVAEEEPTDEPDAPAEAASGE